MNYLYVANWKMNLTYDESIRFCNIHYNDLIKISELHGRMVICPSFDSLSTIASLFQNTSIAIGAQNCSEHEKGSYTGEVSVQSLRDMGVLYCIIGHSERRLYYAETSQTILAKVTLLLQHHIQPIICIGETHQDFLQKKTKMILMQQLDILKLIGNPHNNKIIIGYEPIWAIGTGIIPEKDYLKELFSWLYELISTIYFHPFEMIYGGSITPQNIRSLKNIENVNGFLIGGASTHFDQLSSIIESGRI